MKDKDRYILPKEEKLEDSLAYIQEYIDELKAENANLWEELKQKTGELAKDNEIRKYKDERDNAVKLLSKGFNPSEKQWKKIKEWQEKHYEKCHKKKVEASLPKHPIKRLPQMPSYSYEFSYTQIGCLGSVVCENCKSLVEKKIFANKLFERDKYHELMDKKGAIYHIGEV